MLRFALALAVGSFVAAPLPAQDADALAGKRVVFVGDSITQAGGYVALVTYYLEKSHPKKDFDVLGLGLASETLSGLSEEGHAGGAFPRPCLFERLGRVLGKAKPDVVFACYGMNDGVYQALDKDRFAAFQKGVTKLVEQCKEAGVKQIFLVTPPIYDFTPKAGEFNYDAVLAEYAKWEAALKVDGVTVIDLHAAMRKARDARAEAFSKDKVHPGDDGHLLMARTILAALGMKTPDESVATIKADPLFKLVEQKRGLRSAAWMKHVGYTREKTVKPEPLGTAEADAAKVQEKIDALRRAPAEDRPVVVATSPRGAGHVHPSACRTKDGTLVVVYKGPNVLMRTRSTDGGKTWEAPEPIPTTADRPASVREVKTFEIYPGTADALPDGRVLVTWGVGTTNKGLWYNASADDGKTWTAAPVTLLPETSIAARFYSARTVALDDKHVGTVYLTGSTVYFLKVEADRVAK